LNFKSKYLLALIPLILVLSILYFFSDIVIYIILAWVISMIGAPLVKFLRRFMRKSFAAAITLISFLLLFGTLVWIFVPNIVNQARNLASIDYNEIIKNLEEPMEDWNNWLADKGLIETLQVSEEQLQNQNELDKPGRIRTQVISVDSLLRAQGDSSHTSNVALVIEIDNGDHAIAEENPDEINESDGFIEKVRKQIKALLNPSLLPSIFGSFVGIIGDFLIAILSIFFISFFFLKEQGLFGNMIASVLPDKYEKQGMTALDESSNLLIRYFVGVFFQITIITVFVWIGLSLLGIQNALLIAFFAALMNVIPYLGPLFGAVFAVVITISSQVDVSFYDILLPRLGKVLIVFALMQLMDNFLIQPIVFGKSVKAHPLEIFIVVLVGAKLGGIPGMIIAIPSYTVLRVIGKVFFSEFKIVQSITRSL